MKLQIKGYNYEKLPAPALCNTEYDLNFNHLGDLNTIKRGIDLNGVTSLRLAFFGKLAGMITEDIFVMEWDGKTLRLS